ncbi:MAG: 50S ribosomal protein L2 [Nanoarchaeota archaeon]|nr:50S ribosomal protein L2 [Nanoarchaeota archaeon]MBU4086585.1 50S ribosomal protein L2 [Nanoarchaeota archaeon]
MGKTLIQQARGHGSLTYRVRKQAYVYRIKYPLAEGKGKIADLINSCAHSAPLAKIKTDNEVFYNAAFDGALVGQEIELGGKNVKPGNIMHLRDIPPGTRIFNIELNSGDGGKMMRTAGSSAVLSKIAGSKRGILMPSKKEIFLDENCRATIGVIAGQGRLDKPIIKAGKHWHMMKSKNKLWPRTSAVKMNAIDHPFGSGRGKRIKSKIAKRNAPPGAKVGHLHPRRTGRKKR